MFLHKLKLSLLLHHALVQTVNSVSQVFEELFSRNLLAPNELIHKANIFPNVLFHFKLILLQSFSHGGYVLKLFPQIRVSVVQDFNLLLSVLSLIVGLQNDLLLKSFQFFYFRPHSHCFVKPHFESFKFLFERRGFKRVSLCIL